jgi:AraC-like DNA-binding protein
MTERPNPLLDRPDAPEPPRLSPLRDPLSDVLRTVQLRGSVFFMLDMSSPWAAGMPDGATLAPILVPQAQQVLSFHVVTRGGFWGGLLGEPPVRFEPGDVLVFPRGDGYYFSTARQAPVEPDLAQALGFMRGMKGGQLPFVIQGGGGGADRLGLVCGFLGCDSSPFNPLLASLPRLMHVPRSPGSEGDRLDRLIELTLAEAREPAPGGESVRLRLSELMFVEVIRRYLGGLAPEQSGWLSGLRDEYVGRALALLHERAGHPWTLEGLAADVGLSRSAFADRFARIVGEPPMQYLARWRMQMAARLLSDGTAKVAAVALEVGYDSEAAFSRAFKKLTGLAPAAWRGRRSPDGKPA